MVMDGMLLLVCGLVLVSSFQIPLYHSFGGLSGKSLRGSINVQSRDQVSVTNDNPLTSEQLSQLKNGASYHLSIPLGKPSELSTTKASASVMIPACLLLEGQLSDLVTVHMTSDQSVLGLSVATPVTTCEGRKVSSKKELRSAVKLITMDTLSGPNTKGFLTKAAEAEKVKKQAGTQDERSFFQKYWLYIVIGVGAMMLLQAVSPEEGAGGGA